MLGSWVLATFVMFTDEYYVGLELLRPVILWILLTPAPSPFRGEAGGGHGVLSRQRLTAIAAQWAPYLVSLAAFIAWRGFLQTTPRGQIQIFDHLLRSPAATLLNLAQTILQDIAEVSLVAWWQTLNWKALLGISSLQNLAYIALALATTVVLMIYLLFYTAGSDPRVRPPAGEPNLNPQPNPLPVGRGNNDSRKWAIQAILIGALALFLGGWPFWVTDLPIKLKFPNDRFTLSMMFGACILLVGVISLLARARWQKVILVAALVGLSVGLQFQNGLTYRNDWETQQAFFWQLTWRAPNLQPGTAVMSANMPFKYDTDNSLTAPLNWLYAPDFRGGAQEMPYLMVDIDVRLGNGLEGLQPAQDIHQPYRATSFSGSTSQVIVYAYAPPGCLKILDPAVDSRLPVKSKWVAQALLLSNPEGLIADKEYSSAQPPQHIFGSPPAPDWCYYFEKADLARQIKDWEQVTSLGDQALKLARAASVDKSTGLKEPSELLPFIEGYAHTGQWEKAVELTQQASNLSEKLQPALCDAWDRIRTDTLPNDEKQQALALMTTSLGCRWP